NGKILLLFLISFNLISIYKSLDDELITIQSSVESIRTMVSLLKVTYLSGVTRERYRYILLIGFQ
ncbi:MAG TPA: hypothetical protein VFR94_20420, partial [Nitrososphaeraceae archaeon]|nr:hypothetical protein [Nitrososphaeraceae archaeon]